MSGQPSWNTNPTDRHYLLKVLGISAVPRVITFLLKLLSFPLMVRSLGATQFGVVVYIGAVIAVLESFVDFGVSSAAGKEIAVTRETSSASLSVIIKKWALFQASAALIGLLPLLLATYLVTSLGSNIMFTLQVLIVMVLASWVNIGLNFVRATLTSILAFKSLGGLDAFESVTRSVGWLVVAYYVPTTAGFAWASLLSVLSASIVGIIILWRLVAEFYASDLASLGGNDNVRLHHGSMLKESLNFLWLRLVTRVFQSIPVMVLGRMFGSEVVGVVGAFNRIVELINFPFGVIGNALAVRAPGVIARGVGASRTLWDAVSRFIAVSVMLAATSYLGAEMLSRLLLPASPGAVSLLTILAITVITNAISSVVAPMSDYVGGLRSRNLLLTAFSVFQIAIIILGGMVDGALGAIIAYVLVLVLMNTGYVLIALRMFFPQGDYRIRREINYFMLMSVFGLLLSIALRRGVSLDRWAQVVSIALFWITVIGSLLLHRPSKKFFLSRIFFDFQLGSSTANA
jgi:O-antigen/teichoic acid export membrane protein